MGDLGFVFLWTLALWAMGWLALPFSARLFPQAPDLGLGAGRFGSLLGATLLVFWGASLRLLPLAVAPGVFAFLALAGLAAWSLKSTRPKWREKTRGLLLCDAIFLGFWALLLILRAKNPLVQSFESPMDMAILAGAMRSDFLPFPNPWLADSLFTNYYYFGHLMGTNLSNALSTPPTFAYNLVYAAFGAFFLSLLATLGALLLKSWKWGVGLAILVGLGGHLEPLRQISKTGKIWPLDWWATSRVIPNTINEYPAFTLALGDLHGHFFALSFAIFWLILLFQLAKSGGRRFLVLLGVCALTLGAWLMTNTWDAPLFSLLLLLVLWRRAPSPEARFGSMAVHGGAVFFGALLVAAPYFARFQSQVSGVKIQPYLPDLFSFALLWGGWILLGCLALFLPKISDDESAKWRQNLIFVGVLALLAPCVFYIRGYFGDGELRHQDTVFKFGLQAWLLLGIGISSELFTRLQAAKKPAFGVALLPVWAILALAPLAVWKTRMVDYSPGGWSLNAMKFLPDAQQQAILWLQNEAPPNAILLERPRLENGNPVGDYDVNVGKIATFSGVPTLLGWPQHVWFWGADYNATMGRGHKIEAIFAKNDWKTAREMGATLVFFENAAPSPNQQMEIKSFLGADGSTAAIGILK